MTAHRLQAPSTDGGLLVEPPAAAVGAQLAANSAQLSQWDHDFQGRRADRLRIQVRREVLTLAVNFLGRHGLVGSPFDLDAVSSSARPLLVTGHQPELFHPGVWVKGFAAAGIAGAHQGVALNLIVDNDIPKSTSIQVPLIDKEGIRLMRVEFDRWENDTPYEDLAVLDESRFSTFADRARRDSRRCRHRSLARRLRARRRTSSPRDCLARHAFFAGKARVRGCVGYFQPRGAAQRGLSDGRFSMVRISPSGPASPISTGL